MAPAFPRASPYLGAGLPACSPTVPRQSGLTEPPSSSRRDRKAGAGSTNLAGSSRRSCGRAGTHCHTHPARTTHHRTPSHRPAPPQVRRRQSQREVSTRRHAPHCHRRQAERLRRPSRSYIRCPHPPIAPRAPAVTMAPSRRLLTHWRTGPMQTGLIEPPSGSHRGCEAGAGSTAFTGSTWRQCACTGARLHTHPGRITHHRTPPHCPAPLQVYAGALTPVSARGLSEAAHAPPPAPPTATPPPAVAKLDEVPTPSNHTPPAGRRYVGLSPPFSHTPAHTALSMASMRPTHSVGLPT